MMVALTLMHVVGFKMPVNMTFDVELEGLRLCTREDLCSSWPDLTVKDHRKKKLNKSTDLLRFGSLLTIFCLQNNCRI